MQEQQSRGNPAGLNFEILTGIGAMAETAVRLQFVQPPMLYWIKEVAIRAWAKIDSATSDGSFVKILQGPTEEYAHFISKLKEAIDCSLKDASLREIILKQLAFNNANEDCQAIIRPIRGQGGVMEYLKACRNLGTIQHKAKIATLETLNVSQRCKAKCFNCGKPGHFGKQCRLPRQTGFYLYPRCKKGNHWLHECCSKFDKQDNALPIQKPPSGN